MSERGSTVGVKPSHGKPRALVVCPTRELALQVGRDLDVAGKDLKMRVLTIYGGTGHDHLEGGRGNDKLSGQSGHDLIEGNSGTDTLSGGTGTDILAQGSVSDRVEDRWEDRYGYDD